MSEANTKEIVSNMITKYCEFYQRALDAGFNALEAHQIVKEFLEKGLREAQTMEVAK